MGEFIWTGIDYLGEPTPLLQRMAQPLLALRCYRPGRYPKDRFYLYRSHWNKDAETLHILPHWTWPWARRYR